MLTSTHVREWKGKAGVGGRVLQGQRVVKDRAAANGVPFVQSIAGILLCQELALAQEPAGHRCGD